MLLLGVLVRCGAGRSNPVAERPLPPLITEAPQDQTVKAPAPATFGATASGSPAPTYQWNLNGAPIPGATSNYYTTPSTDSSMNGGLYTLTATNDQGSVTSAPGALVVNGPPVITSQPANTLVRLGSAATFTVVAAGTGGFTFAWSKGGSAIDGATGASYRTPAATLDMNASTYSVAVTSPNGTVNSAQATLTVAFGPTITIQPASKAVTVPSEAAFNVVAEGNPLTYQWNLNGKPIQGAIKDTWSVPATAVAMNGDVYTVTVSCAGTAVTSDPAVLSVSGPPVITTQPVGASVIAGSAFSLSVVASGVPAALTYQWFKNAEPISNATNPAYPVAAATAADDGTYYVMVSNGVGNGTQSANAVVAVAAGHTVSGAVKAGSTAIGGVTLELGTTPSRTATTAADGTYAFQNVPAGSYVLTPSAPALSAVFLPSTLSLAVADEDLTEDFNAALGFTVSGVFNNPDPDPGTTYFTLTPDGGGSPIGTAHQAQVTGNTFVFKGVPPGTYTLAARLDIFDKGLVNAHDPAGALSTPVTVGTGDVTGLSLDLAAGAPSLSGMAGPAFQATPMAGGVVIDYKPILADGVEQPRQYRVEWSTDASFSSLTGFRLFPPTPAHILALSSSLLVDGTSYYLRMTGVGPTTATGAFTAGPVTVAAGTGLNTVSGEVNFTPAPKGSLYVGFRDTSAGKTWLTRVTSPKNPQAFSISGIPDGTFERVALLDQDQNGLISFGDASALAASTVGGDLTGVEETLPTALSSARVATQHLRPDGAADLYRLLFTVQDGVNHVVSAVVTSGPNVVVPASLGSNGGGTTISFADPATVRPAVGDAYTIQEPYFDGTSGSVTARVTGVLDAFPGSLEPVTGDQSGTDPDLMPVFSWTAPAEPPASFHYAFTLTGPGVSWSIPVLPSTATEFQWSPAMAGVTEATGTLAPGTTYEWTLSVVDGFGNEATSKASYTP